MADESFDRDQAVAMHSAQDRAQAARVPNLVPEGWEGKKFARPRFPAGVFAVIKPDTDYWGPFRSEDFVVEPATNIYTAHNQETGEPVILRVLGQNGEDALCVDDTGEQIQYRLRAIPDNILPIQEPGLGR